MKKTAIWKGLAAFGLVAVLVLTSVLVFHQADKTIYAAGDTYQVGSEAELQEAIDKYADNDTIKLTNSVTLMDTHNLNLTKSVTLDLNGQTLASAPEYNIIEFDASGKTLTIVDSVGGGMLLGDDNTIHIAGSGNSVAVNGGILMTNHRQTISVTGEKNTLTVNGGEIRNGIWGAGMDLAVAVHGGVISSDETAVELSGAVKFDMDGGEIKAHNLGLSIEDELLTSTASSSLTIEPQTETLPTEEITDDTSEDASSEDASEEGSEESGEDTSEETSEETTPEETTTEEPTTEEPTTEQPTPPAPKHNTNATINISGGSITSEYDSAIFLPEKGTMMISGGTITGHTAVYLQSGLTTITGGTFIANGEATQFADTGDYSGCTATGDAIVAEACENDAGLVQLAITGGTFISQYGKPVASYQASDGPAWADDTAKRIGGFVSGGWFSTKVANAGDVYTQDILAKGLSATEACTAEEGAPEGAPFSLGYQISFNANGGDEIKDIYVAPLGDAAHLGKLKAFPTPKRANCNFKGWFDAATGGKEVKAGGVTELKADTTLYAQWDVVQYKIKYNLDGGKVALKNPETYAADSAEFTLTNPTKDGFYFKGWTGTGLKEPTQKVTIPKGSTGDREYTANWGLPGEIKNSTDAKTNACHAQIDDTIKDLGGVVLNAEDMNRVKNGESIAIQLKATDVSTTVKEEQKNIIAQGMPEGDVAAVYLDMNLYKTVGSDQQKEVTNPKGNITITLTVPENLWPKTGEKRFFSIIHLHNGLAQRVDSVYDASKHTLTFKTSGFSIFTLTYNDEKAPEDPTTIPDGGGKDKKESGSILSSWIFWVILAVVVIAVVLIVVLTTLKKKRSRTDDGDYNDDDYPDDSEE